MHTINDLVEAAFYGKKAKIEKYLYGNININAKASYPTEGLRNLFNTVFEWEFKHPLRSRLGALHPKKWRCSSWRIEMLNNFTPLAAAIFGEHKHLVTWLLEECSADISINITINSYSQTAKWDDCFENVNMLGLALMVGNPNIIDIICNHLQKLNKFGNAIHETIIVKEIYKPVSIDVYEIPLRLKDYTSFRVLFGYYKATGLDLSLFCNWIKENYGVVHGATVRKLFSVILQGSVQKDIEFEMFASNVVWLAAENRDNETSEYLIKLLSEESINSILIQGKDAEYDIGNNEVHNAVELQSMYLLEKLFNSANKVNAKKVNVQNADGNTPLHLSLLQSSCDAKIIKFLVDHGAVTDIRNNDRKTAIDLCRQPYVTKNILTQRAQIKNKALQDAGEEQPGIEVVKSKYSSCGCLWLPSFMVNTREQQPVSAAAEVEKIEGGKNKLALL